MANAPLCSLQLVTGMAQENCYLLWREGARECIVFDPGDEAERILAAMSDRKLTPAAIVLTHCHFDHIGAIRDLKVVFPDVPVYCPREEETWLAKPTLNLSYFVGHSITAPPPDELVDDGDELKLAELVLKAILVPGHSPGGTAYFVEDGDGRTPHLFDGDILFAQGIGRTDLPGAGGDGTLVSGIRERLFTLPDETIVHPGHNQETTIGDEKRLNPYCGLSSS